MSVQSGHACYTLKEQGLVKSVKITVIIAAQNHFRASKNTV